MIEPAQELRTSAQPVWAYDAGQYTQIVGRKKGGVPSDTSPKLSAVSRMERLFHCVNAGAKVNVKRRPIHH